MSFDDDDESLPGSRPIEPLYGEGFDWSPTYQPPARDRGSQRRRRYAMRHSQASSSSPPPSVAPPPSPSPTSPPWARRAPSLAPTSVSTRLLLIGLRGLAALPPLWPLLVLAPFVFTGWTCWYLGRQLPGSVLSLAPLALLSAVPVVFNSLSHLLGILGQRTTGPLLSQGAGRWLLAHLEHLPPVGRAGDRADRAPRLTVARLRDGGRSSCYVPKHRTIILADDLIDETTAAAHAVAAHELGHHLLHERAPRLCTALTWVRNRTQLSFHAGLMLLCATALTGEQRWLALAPTCFVAAGLAQTAIAVEEAAASAVALRELRRAGMGPAQLRLARRFLISAFATYASLAAALLVPLWWPQLLEGAVAFGSARPPAPPLSSFSSWVIVLAFVAILSAALLAGRDLAGRRPRQLRVPASLVTLLALLLVPFIFVFLANQPVGRAFPWPVLLALFPAYHIVSAPPRLLLSTLAAALLPTLAPARAVRCAPSPGDFPAISADVLRAPDGGRGAVLVLVAALLLALPLAALYLGSPLL